MTKEREKQLRTAQRKMLRWIVGVGRKRNTGGARGKEEGIESDEDEHPEPQDDEEGEQDDKKEDETWVEWIQRATHIAENHLKKKARIDDWVTKSRTLKWTWAGHVARRTDGRWSTAVLSWEPHGGRRRVGRPVARWRDDLDTYAVEHFNVGENEWILFAADRDSWDNCKDDYSQYIQR